MKKTFASGLDNNRALISGDHAERISRRLCLLIALFAATEVFGAVAQIEPIVTERGAHHRVWQTISQQVRPDGQVNNRTNSYVELGSGLHFQQDGQWVESQEVIELLQGGTGAVARQGQHQVFFAPNINTLGAINLATPDGKRFRSHILGLAYTDARTGNSAMIADIKDSIGQLIAPNQVVYPDAFTDFKADIRYIYRKGSFEQDVILRENPPPPEAYGFSSQTTRLQVWTEFVEAAAPTKTPVLLRQEEDPQVRLTMAEPDLVDYSLDFGETRIGSGKAFAIDLAANPGPYRKLPVAKDWTAAEGRIFLIESVEYPPIQTLLGVLPAAAALGPQKNPNQELAALRKHKGLPRTQWMALLPRKAQRPQKDKFKQTQVAAYKPSGTSVVIDYQQVLTTTNMLFRGDTTYCVSNSFSLSSTTTIEGGSVVKFSGAASLIQNGGNVSCLTGPYRPAIFTSTDDNTVGETISGSTGSPSACYDTDPFACTIYLWLSGLSGVDLKYLHVRYAHLGLLFDSSGVDTFSHLQFLHCQNGIYADFATLLLRNVLMHDLETGIIGYGYVGSGEHLTANKCSQLAHDPYSGGGAFSLTNCLLVNVTNSGNALLDTNCIAWVTDSSVLQTVGAAGHYLASGSLYRNAGTTNINSTLLSELRSKTTYPPVVVPQGTFSNSLVLSPQAQRDTDAPDLGYHYDPIDYAFGNVTLQDATVTLKAGAAVAAYASTYGTPGLALGNNSQFLSEGSPTNLARIVRYNMVQEQVNTNWSAYQHDMVLAGSTYSVSPQARFRFTGWSVPAQDNYHFYGPGNMTEVSFTDCQFQGGYLASESPSLRATNNLFERVYVSALELNASMNVTFPNNTFYGGTLELLQSSGTWTFKNNLFDRTTNSVLGGVFTNDYNAYVTTNYGVISAIAAHDIVLTNSPAYQLGSLGSYYFPTNSSLINAGSVTNAALAGLYHYTTTTNQVKEGTSRLDIGFHYIATANGVPVDTDNDGVPDYQEDSNGSGSVSSGETDWNNATDLGLKVLITRPRNGSNLP
jgi:hypothetical protein